MNKYTIENEIKRGAFGVIYKGTVKKTKEPVAIKIDHSQMPTLQHEVRMIQYLYMAKVREIPSVYWFGMHEEKPCFIMTYFECSLFDYSTKKTIDKEKADMMLLKILDIFENIHKLFVLHRDIKPQNFMIKDGDIYLIDFGLSMFYINENGEHYPDRISDTMIGSPQFASIHIHNGNRYSRRDDLIALGYLYLFMIGSPFVPIHETSELPLINILHPMNVSLKKQKEMDHLRTLFSNKTIEYYMNYVYSLEYAELPKYEPLKMMFIQKG
jgi:serine/threonine protein kinase